MRIIFVLSLMFFSFSAFALSDLPYTAFYGQYEIMNCKKIEAINPKHDLCSTAKIIIQKGNPCWGPVPFVAAFFPTAGEKIYPVCNTTPNRVLPPEEFQFIAGEGLNSEHFKREQDEEGFEHYYIRSTGDDKYYEYLDFWMKRNDDQTVIAKLKRRKVLISSPDVPLNSIQYEFKLKPIK